jgi:hypothetical protein
MDLEADKANLRAQQIKAKNKVYYDKNKEKLIAKKREAYNAEARRAYYEANKEKLKQNKMEKQHIVTAQRVKDYINNLMEIAQPPAKAMLERMLEKVDTEEGLQLEAVYGMEILIRNTAHINDKPLPLPPVQEKPEKWVMDAKECLPLPVIKEDEKEE